MFCSANITLQRGVIWDLAQSARKIFPCALKNFPCALSQISNHTSPQGDVCTRKGGIYLDCADCWEGRISGQWQRCARGVQLTRPGRFHTNLTICDDWQPGRSVNMVERFWSNDGHTIRREGRLLLVSLVGRNKKLFKSFLSYIWQQMEANDKQKQLFTHYVNSQVREGLFGQMFPKSWYC